MVIKTQEDTGLLNMIARHITVRMVYLSITMAILRVSASSTVADSGVGIAHGIHRCHHAGVGIDDGAGQTVGFG